MVYQVSLKLELYAKFNQILDFVQVIPNFTFMDFAPLEKGDLVQAVAALYPQSQNLRPYLLRYIELQFRNEILHGLVSKLASTHHQSAEHFVPEIA